MSEYSIGYDPTQEPFQAEEPAKVEESSIEQKSSWRLKAAFETEIKALLGEVKIEGLDNLKEIPKGRKVVIATSHISDIDIPVAVYAMADKLDVLITNQSTQYSFMVDPASNVGMRIAGRDNFMPIDYKVAADPKAPKEPNSFNPENFENMIPAMEKGKAVIMAAHNPSHSGHLEKGGYGAVYLAEISDAIIVPVGVSVESVDGEQLGMAENAVATIKNRPKTDVQIGKPFELEKIPNIQNFQTILAKRKNGEKISKEERTEFLEITKQLSDRSDKLMEKISDLVWEEKR